MVLQLPELLALLGPGALYGPLIQLHYAVDELLLSSAEQISLEKEKRNPQTDKPKENGAAHPPGPAPSPDKPEIKGYHDSYEQQ